MKFGTIIVNLYQNRLMFKNFIKTYFRNLYSQRGFSFINIIGLSIGLTISGFIFLYINSEYNYDKFNLNYKNIYRIAVRAEISGQKLNAAISSAPIGLALRNEFPEVILSTRIHKINQTILLGYGDKKFYEENIIFADTSFFKIFSFNFLVGNPDKALSEPYSIVLTEKIAKKFFGNQNPIGQIIRWNNNENYIITGIIKNIPSHSHIKFDIVVSFSSLYKSENAENINDWLTLRFYSYILADEKIDIVKMENKIPSIISKNIEDDLSEYGIIYEPYFQPLKDIHLHSDIMGEISQNNNMLNIYILISIAIFIIIIASINFMNLSTARSSKRNIEVGIRKVLGGSNTNLFGQFIGESVFLSLIAFILALVFIEFLTPLINQVFNVNIDFNILIDYKFIVVFLCITFITGLFSGIYPAIYYSLKNPIKVLKFRYLKNDKNINIRKYLVIIQFILAIIMIISTIIIYKQLQFIQISDLGYNSEQVIIIPLRNEDIKQKKEFIKSELKKSPVVKNISFSEEFLGGGLRGHGFYPEGKSKNNPWLIYNFEVDEDFVNTMEIRIIKGRNFKGAKSDTNYILINETLQKMLEWEDAIGKKISYKLEDETRVDLEVIGVVKDFHFQSLHEIMEPAILHFNNKNPNFLNIRLNCIKRNNKSCIESLEKYWNNINTEFPFDYFYLKDNNKEKYESENRMAKIVFVLTILAIFVAVLGLFGLTAYTTEQRTKEIGIRKAFGATALKIIMQFSREFTIWLIIANIIAWPVSYYIVNLWLTNFQYKTPLSIFIFIYAGIISILIALFTINIQSIKIALQNPVKSLRYE
ncbi:MAG: ABC transporter permease [Bacteroidales bacterium]|nr:ABC transporter permease [Bacteroidales bacterium]